MMTIAFAVRHTDGSHAVFVDRGAADRYVATCRQAVAVVPLVSRDAVDRKLDAYVPADQVSSLRWRVAELEAIVAGDTASLDPASAADYVLAWAWRLAAAAEVAGLVLTIERVPSGPPRMGGHRAEIRVRPSMQALRKSGAAL